MSVSKNEFDIAKNIKIIDWLKAEMIGSVSNLFKAMLKGTEDLVVDALAGVILTAYLLAKRLGISFSRVDLKIESKLRQNIDDGHEVETWFGDITSLLMYMAGKKK